MSHYKELIQGFKAFKQSADPETFSELSKGQKPKTMFIACSDSRVDPAILCQCQAGEIFTVRNVANIVPPYEDDKGRHGVSSALEFAVSALKIENLIVLGHSGCGGISALLSGSYPHQEKSFIARWMAIPQKGIEKALHEHHNKDPEHQQCIAEQSNIVLSLENLKQFPFIKAALIQKDLELHGWYFDFKEGKILAYQEENNQFKSIEEIQATLS